MEDFDLKFIIEYASCMEEYETQLIAYVNKCIELINKSHDVYIGNRGFIYSICIEFEDFFETDFKDIKDDRFLEIIKIAHMIHEAELENKDNNVYYGLCDFPDCDGWCPQSDGRCACRNRRCHFNIDDPHIDWLYATSLYNNKIIVQPIAY